MVRIAIGLCSSLALLLLILPGCSSYQTLTGYFNTYYNASKFYSDAVTEIEKAPQKDRDTNYFAAYQIPKTAADKLDKVIEKCSRLIEQYPQSALVDDALLMIEKSYVYENEYESALRKFRELQDNFPSSDLIHEGKIWSAKALYCSKKDDEALQVIKESLPDVQAAGQNDIEIEMYMLQGQIFFDRAEYDQAASMDSAAVEISGDDQLRARACEQLGLCQERLGNFVQAALAYGRVQSFGPDFDVEFRTRLKAGMMEASSGQHEKALETFDDLRGEILKPEERGLVELESANTYRMMGDTGRAIAMYDEIDTLYKRTDASAQSYYERGLLYEKEVRDYETARSFYDKAKTEAAASPITPRAQEKSKTFAAYFLANAKLAQCDSLLYQALHRDTTSVAALVKSHGADSLVGWSGSTYTDSAHASMFTQALFSDTVNGTNHPAVNNRSIANEEASPKFKPPDRTAEHVGLPPPPGAEPPSEAELQTRRVSLEGGNEDEESDEDLPAQHRQGGEHRRGGEHQRFADSRDDAERDTAHSAGSDSLQQKRAAPLVKIPNNLSPDSLRSLIGQTEFELAGLFFLELEVPDSAIHWYQKVVDENPNSPLVPRALYAISEIRRDQGDSTAVDSIYKIILDKYDQTEYSQQVRSTLGMDTTGVVEDVDPAEPTYARAESLLQSGEAKIALREYRSILKKFPKSKLTAKTLYAIGWIYESVLVQNDSAAIWYKKLIKEYPSSIYAAEAKPKVAVKDDPKTLSQYVKIKEIQPLGHVPEPTGKQGVALKDKNAEDTDEDEQDEEVRPGQQNKDENDEDQQDEDQQDDEPSDNDDGGGG